VIGIIRDLKSIAMIVHLATGLHIIAGQNSQTGKECSHDLSEELRKRIIIVAIAPGPILKISMPTK
jgi:hypothetical protein